MNTTDNKTNVHTPVSLMAVFANAFKIEIDNSIIWLKGVYKDRGKISYEGYYYDRLKDEIGGQIITLKLPESIKSTMNHGSLYIFKGILEKDVRRDGVIEPVFIVTEMAGQAASLLPDGVNRRVDIQQQKANKGYRDLNQAIKQKLYQGKQPCIALVCGKTSIVLEDVTSALKGSRTSYDLVERRVNLSSKEAIIDSFVHHNNKKFDAIAIIRGGGPGLEIFDDVQIAESSLKLEPMLVTAIGHAKDVTLLERIADKKFTTPTALGTYLKEMVEDVGREKTYTKTKLPILWMTISLLLLIIGFGLGIILSGLM